MTDERDPRPDSFAVDVRALMERSVASLYSHLVTRPTGRAVREAIERQLDELCGPTLSLVDLSAVSILDYSCADEVVAKLLLRYGKKEARGEASPFFVLRGVRDHHRDPIEAVLERHELAIVAETAPARFEALGALSREEQLLWERVERRRRVSAAAVIDLSEGADPSGLDRLIQRGLLFRDPRAGDVHALSTLVATGPPGRESSTPGNHDPRAGV